MAGRVTPHSDNWGPVVEIWVDDTSDGQSVFITGERADGQLFFGSFFQSTIDDDQEGSDSAWRIEE
jgi:hypothetical protein